MGRYEDYLEMHEADNYDDEDETIHQNCSVCGADYGKIYHIEGEYLCGDCLLEKYYHGDAIEFPTEIHCDRCGEPIEKEIYCVQDANGECEFFDEECLIDLAENEEI